MFSGAPKIVPMYLFGEALETALMPKPLRTIKEMVIPRTWFNRWVRSVHGMWVGLYFLCWRRKHETIIKRWNAIGSMFHLYVL